MLGGEFYRVKTYGDLITSITNPDHIISEEYKNRFSKEFPPAHSAMPNVINELTVQELIDLIAFLSAQYKAYRPEFVDPTHVFFPF